MSTSTVQIGSKPKKPMHDKKRGSGSSASGSVGSSDSRPRSAPSSAPSIESFPPPPVSHSNGELAAVTKDGVQFFSVSENALNSMGVPFPIGLSTSESFAWNSDGSLFGRILPSGGVAVHAFPSMELLLETPVLLKGAKAFYFSPESTYLVIADRFEPKTEKENCALYHLPTRSKVGEIIVRKLASPNWPVMRWTEDEALCLRVSKETSAGEQILVLNSKSNKAETIGLPGLSAFEISPKEGRYMAAFFDRRMEAGGRPAPNENSEPRICIYSLYSATPGAAIFTLPLIEDPADSVTMHWNSTGDSLLVQAIVQVDESGKTYYGKSNLYVISRGEAGWTFNRPVELVGSPLHEARWLGSRSFIAVAGKMPAVVGCYTVESSGEISRSFPMGRVPRNTVRVSVHGRYAAIGGFGNLPGEVDFWDLDQRKVLKTTRSECTVDLQWAPSGARLFITSTTTPRMRVDNAIQLWRYGGERLAEINFKELFAAVWRPVKDGRPLLPDIPSSPRYLATASEGPMKTETTRQAYRAPGGAGEGFFAAVVRGERKADELPTDQRRELLSGRGGRKGAAVIKAPSKWDGVGAGEVIRAAVNPDVGSQPISLDGVAPNPISDPVEIPTVTAGILPTPPTPPPPPPPPPKKEWYYRDPSGVEQGPFEWSMMQRWHGAGYFGGDLDIRRGPSGEFRKLAAAFEGTPFNSRYLGSL